MRRKVLRHLQSRKLGSCAARSTGCGTRSSPGGISNALEVIEQITYLLFLRRLDELQNRAERKARVGGRVIENPMKSSSVK